MSGNKTCLWIYRYTAPETLDRVHKTECGWVTAATLTGDYCCYCGKKRLEQDLAVIFATRQQAIENREDDEYLVRVRIEAKK